MKNLKARYEPFGGIIGLTEPPSLVYVDRAYMRRLGYKDSPLWHGRQSHLSAPTEVHFSITNICPLGCRHCSSDARDEADERGEMTTEAIKQALDVLASMQVFHVALGGGELFARPDAIEIAEYAASLGIVPNATINGYYMDPELARQCRVFGQVNVSLDGVGERYALVRGVDNFDRADRAIGLLKEAGVSTGVNCVVTRANFDHLEEVVSYADERGLSEVLFLRLKPSGRAQGIYQDFRLTQEQAIGFYPFLMRMARKYRPLLQADCSFVSMLCYHRPSKKIMRMLGVEGCEGGNILLGMRPDGWVNACSHFPQYYQDIFDLPDIWQCASALRAIQRTADNRGFLPQVWLFLHLPRRVPAIFPPFTGGFPSARSGMPPPRGKGRTDGAVRLSIGTLGGIALPRIIRRPVLIFAPILLIAALLAVYSAIVLRVTVTAPPRIMEVGRFSATILWETNRETRGELRFHTGSDPEQAVRESGRDRRHMIRLAGLLPETEYTYTISGQPGHPLRFSHHAPVRDGFPVHDPPPRSPLPGQPDEDIRTGDQHPSAGLCHRYR